MSSGVYIHIPFCVKKCLYCDFPSSDKADKLKAPYVHALISEIESGLPKDYDTVFIGGGTPTFLPLPDLLSVVRTVAKDGCEFTVEVNPATLDFEGFCALKAAGVNRISLGLQSAHDDELKALGRIHGYTDFLAAFQNARRADFDNINVDVMFSLPDQTPDKFAHTLDTVCALSPEHISCYSLIVERGTPFYDMSLSLPDEDEDRAMYQYCVAFLSENGYRQYEISNFAKDGFACRHNIKYWRREDYYGFGAAAHSLVGSVRYENSADIAEYIHCNHRSATPLTVKDIKNETILLGLRMPQGINLRNYQALFGCDFMKEHSQAIKKYREFCVSDGEFFGLTPEGFGVSNAIICDFME